MKPNQRAAYERGRGMYGAHLAGHPVRATLAGLDKVFDAALAHRGL
jgi:hypothetical protein